jgi:hypothetical protein
MGRNESIELHFPRLGPRKRQIRFEDATRRSRVIYIYIYTVLDADLQASLTTPHYLTFSTRHMMTRTLHSAHRQPPYILVPLNLLALLVGDVLWYERGEMAGA